MKKITISVASLLIFLACNNAESVYLGKEIKIFYSPLGDYYIKVFDTKDDLLDLLGIQISVPGNSTAGFNKGIARLYTRDGKFVDEVEVIGYLYPEYLKHSIWYEHCTFPSSGAYPDLDRLLTLDRELYLRSYHKQAEENCGEFIGKGILESEFLNMDPDLEKQTIISYSTDKNIKKVLEFEQKKLKKISIYKFNLLNELLEINAHGKTETFYSPTGKLCYQEVNQVVQFQDPSKDCDYNAWKYVNMDK